MLPGSARWSAKRMKRIKASTKAIGLYYIVHYLVLILGISISLMAVTPYLFCFFLLFSSCQSRENVPSSREAMARRGQQQSMALQSKAQRLCVIIGPASRCYNCRWNDARRWGHGTYSWHFNSPASSRSWSLPSPLSRTVRGKQPGLCLLQRIRCRQ